MGSTACVVIPFGGDCEDRRAALRWVTDRYGAEGLETLVVEVPEGLWIKAIPVRQGLESVDADTIVIVADADAWTDGLPEAIAAVERGAPWAIPHQLVHRLSQQGTEAVYGGSAPRTQPVERRPYRGTEGGGFVVARVQTLLDIPMDPRYENWGQEDASLGHALRTLLGPPWRGRAPLWHLHHPPMPRMTSKRGSVASWALYRRYLQASKDPVRMKALIGEVHESLNTSERPGDDHPPVHLLGGL